MSFLQGENVYLRPFKKEDFDMIFHNVQDKEIRRLTGTQTFFTMGKIEKAYESFALDKTRMDLVIAMKETDEAIGDLALLDIDLLNRNASIRIALNEEKHRGRGFGTEALRLILQHGFHNLGLYRVGLNVYHYNERAKRSYEKLGFKQEGVIRGELFYDGDFHDNILMGVLADEFWEADKKRGTL
ncbi:aminoglycoside 6'-acetyltransferase [Bacillus sp. HMSC76G11]|uniref:GNAT family N-acetyltransferase n=1 Tax=Metabacillus idriensis TaxID=324768 RepID=A0A6I2MKZ6_9BACI|nr:GNAT family protein [Metabacillus idriensis]MRX56533.1 GNAT family N-acetyltransferase [Metabacillus idriensis]OHR73427.1 aminoglycoside 6'-acetyltransferase [Bacillus sp. HMSC76G11]